MKLPRWRLSLVMPAVITVFAAALVAGATGQAALASARGPHVTAIPAQRAVLGEPVSLQVHATATGGTAWYLARHLPPGLSIGFQTGKINGRPRVTAGTWVTRVTVHTHRGSASVSFRWRVASRPGEVTGYGAKCADVHAGNMRYGTKIDIWTCNFKPQQRIAFRASGELVVSGWCVTGPGRVHLARCHGWRTQTWRRRPDGEYALQSNGQCLTGPSTSPGSGRLLSVARCAATTSQHWSLPRPQPAPSAVPPPTDEKTSQGPAYQPGAPASFGCGAASSDLPWVGATDTVNGKSDLTLNVLITPANANGTVQAKYFMWDDGTPIADPAGINGMSLAQYGTVVTSNNLNFTLTDGHHYTWTAEAVTTNPDGTTEVSARAPVCGFQVDAAAPTRPAVSSSDFPPSGSGKAGPPAGSSGTFAFSSTDPVPSCGGCQASGVYEFAYSLNSPVLAASASAKHTGCGYATSTSGIVKADSSGKATSCQVGVGSWGTNILYVEAIDKAGNVSASYDYYFYVPSS